MAPNQQAKCELHFFVVQNREGVSHAAKKRTALTLLTQLNPFCLLPLFLINSSGCYLCLGYLRLLIEYICVCVGLFYAVIVSDFYRPLWETVTSLVQKNVLFQLFNTAQTCENNTIDCIKHGRSVCDITHRFLRSLKWAEPAVVILAVRHRVFLGNRECQKKRDEVRAEVPGC